MMLIHVRRCSWSQNSGSGLYESSYSIFGVNSCSDATTPLIKQLANSLFIALLGKNHILQMC